MTLTNQSSRGRARRLWFPVGLVVVLPGIVAVVVLLQRNASDAEANSTNSTRVDRVVPAPGTYAFALDRREGDKRHRYNSVMTVHRLRGPDSESGLLISSRFHESTISRQFAIDGTGWDAVATTFARSSDTSRCAWDHPHLVIPMPLKLGEAWKTEASCVMAAGTEAIDIKVTTTSRLEAGPIRKVAGINVATVRVVRRVLLRTRTTLGTKVRTSNVQELFAPKYGLTVLRSERGSETDSARPNAAPYRFSETIKLTTLEPTRATD